MVLAVVTLWFKIMGYRNKTYLMLGHNTERQKKKMNSYFCLNMSIDEVAQVIVSTNHQLSCITGYIAHY